MNVVISFDVGETHYARRLDLKKDGEAIAALGQRCAGYLRQTTDGTFDAEAAPRVFLQRLQPINVPSEHSFVLGIFRRTGRGGRKAPRPVGVLYFVHPDQAPGTWSILLLLLEPAARRGGLGSTVHAAFAQWAAARGARRLVVAVSEANSEALHFWRDRLGYTETAASRPLPAGARCRRRRELEHWLAPVPSAAPWMRMRV